MGLENLSFNSQRKFGIELEILSFDKKSRPEGETMPKGYDYVTMLVKNNVEEDVETRNYEHTQDNNYWVVKPDSSCGLEVCTPVVRGWPGISKVAKVVEAFGKDPQIQVDSRCSVHVHVDLSDLSEQQIGSVVAHWLKCEPVMIDSVPASRKRNRYCQVIGLTSVMDTEHHLSPRELITKVGEIKYYSMNTQQMIKSSFNRKTIEFRITEGQGCKDAYLIKNWTRLLLHFVERTSKMPYPVPYEKDNPWSSFLWLDPKDVFHVFGFDVKPPAYELSNGLTQTRNWFAARLCRNMSPDLGKGPRHKAYQELMEICAGLKEVSGSDFNVEQHLAPSDLEDALYNTNFRF